MKNTYLAILFVLASVKLSAQIYTTGCLFDEEKHRQIPVTPIMLTRNYTQLPMAASMKNYCPIPQSQNPFNTCVGWSTGYGARTIIEAMKNGWTDKKIITENAFSPSYLYNQIRPTDGCMGSTYIHEALNIMVEQGCAKMQDFPDNCSATITYNDKAKAASYKISSYKSLTPYGWEGVRSIDLMKKSLSEKKPVIITMKCYESFMRVGSVGLWNGVADKYYGYHAMVVVGYDDNKSGGSFELMNSWGTQWANGGFCWVKYSDIEKQCAGAYELVEEIPSTPIVPEIVVTKPIEPNKPTEPTKPTPNNDNINNIPFDINGELKFVSPTGQAMTADFYDGSFKMRRAYSSGTQFRIYLSVKNPSYVYVLGGDLGTEITQLFPHSPTVSPALNYSLNEIALPSEEHYIEMDEKVGKDYLCVIFSKKPLNLKAVRDKVALNPATNFPDKIKNTLQAVLVQPEHMELKGGDSMKFRARSNGKNVMAIMVETDHSR